MLSAGDLVPTACRWDPTRGILRVDYDDFTGTNDWVVGGGSIRYTVAGSMHATVYVSYLNDLSRRRGPYIYSLGLDRRRRERAKRESCADHGNGKMFNTHQFLPKGSRFKSDTSLF